jgi:hypothetical protein
MSVSGVVTIGHLVTQYRVRRDHPAPETVRWRLDDLTRVLPDALGAALAPLLDAGGDEIVLIRRLHAELDLDVSRDPPALARRWASRIGAALSRTLVAESGDVLRFPGWTHYLARFLVDASAGAAAGAWPYRPFGGLSALPRSAQLRTAILTDPGDGVRALRLLADRERRQVLAALGSTEARRVVEALTRLPGPRDDATAFPAVAGALGAGGLTFTSEAAPWLAALDLLVRAPMPEAGGAVPAAMYLAVAIAAFDRTVASAGDATLLALLEAPPDAPHVALAPEARRRLQPLLALPGPGRRRIADMLTARSRAPRRPDAAAEPDEPPTTPFGGLVLLLPALAGWDLDGVVEGLAGRSSAEAVAIVRLVLLAKCAGGRRASAVVGDPLLRGLTGVPTHVLTADVLAWLRTHGDALVRRLAHHRASRGEPVSWRLGVTRHRGERLLVVSELPRDRWWAVVRLRDETARLARARAWPSLLTAVAAGGAAPWPEPARDLVHARGLRAQLDHLALPAAWDVPIELDLALSAIAQSLLRDFGGRLPGFSASSPAFVYASFLDFPAAHELRDGRRLVQVGRPPLNVVLAMTGIARGVLSVPWLEPPRIELFPAA